MPKELIFSPIELLGSLVHVSPSDNAKKTVQALCTSRFSLSKHCTSINHGKMVKLVKQAIRQGH